MSSTPERVVELCRLMYQLGWASGTGGGISIRDEAGIWVAPSGVQKERIEPEEVFLVDVDGTVLRRPQDPSLRLSECTPLFFNAYRHRGARAVLHSHSIWAMLATRVFASGGGAGVFISRDLEMQKGLRGKGCFERVEVPIVQNTAREAELEERMLKAMQAHEDVDAVLVNGHGVYVWGESWVKAKTQAECYDYLFRAAVDLHRLGLTNPERHDGTQLA